MEATPLPQVAETSSGASTPADGSAAFADVVAAWHGRGEPVPVAVVASVFDDVLASSVTADGAGALELASLRVRPDGQAYAARDAKLRAVWPLLMEALGADLVGDHAVPPSAWALFDRLTSDDPADHPADADQLRQWLRESLGAPASHDEVRDFVFAALMGGQDAPARPDLPVAKEADEANDSEVHDLETLPPHPVHAPLPIPDPVADAAFATLPPERDADDHQLSTDVVRKRDIPRDLGPRTDVERATHLPEPLPDSLEPAAVVAESHHREASETVLPTTIDAAPPSAVQAAREGEAPAPSEVLDEDAVAATSVMAPPPIEAAPSAMPEPVVPEPLGPEATAMPEPVVPEPLGPEPTAMPEPLESELESAVRSAEPRTDSERRRVVRHNLDRPLHPVSLGTAPAARRSARSSPHGGDSIMVPADRVKAWVWVGVLAALCAAVYVLFFR